MPASCKNGKGNCTNFPCEGQMRNICPSGKRFANLVWDNEPIPSGQLVKLCEQVFQWKKPTTYTVLRKLCEKGLFQNVNGVVSSVMSREEFASRRSEQFVDNAFHGSLPAFVAAFTAQKPLSAQEAEEIQQMIDKFRKEE